MSSPNALYQECERHTMIPDHAPSSVYRHEINEFEKKVSSNFAFLSECLSKWNKNKWNKNKNKRPHLNNKRVIVICKMLAHI